MRICSSCGAVNNTEAKFCENCGKQFEYAGGSPIEENAKPVQEIQPEPQSAPELKEHVFAEPKPEPIPHKGRAITFGIIGFILGINALIFSWVPLCQLIFLIMAIIGLVFCNKSRKYMKFKLAGAGKVLSIIAIIICAIFIAFTIFLIIYYQDDLADMIRRLVEYLNNVEIRIDIN